MGRPLLYILLGILAVVGLYAFMHKPQPPAPQDEADEPVEALDPNIAATKTMLAERDLPGDPPPLPPVFHCRVEVDPPPGKRIYLYVTEEHGYYAETFYVQLSKKNVDDTSGLHLYFDKYLPANDTLVLSTALTDPDITSYANGDMGTGDDWTVEITCGRARVENPDPLPPQAP